MSKSQSRRKKVEICDLDKFRENCWKNARDNDVNARNNFRKRPDKPLTENHLQYIKYIETHAVTIAIGPAGTGKTALACGVAIKMLMSGEISRIVLCRPLVQCGEDLGILPGTMEEKMAPYLAPLAEQLKEKLRGGEYESLVEAGIIEVCPLATMRGRTFHNAIVILDEAENASSAQIRMFLTRLGYHSKMVVNGDITQSDIWAVDVPLLNVVNKLTGNPEIASIFMNRTDVLRPELVQWIDEKLTEDLPLLEEPPSYGKLASHPRKKCS